MSFKFIGVFIYGKIELNKQNSGTEKVIYIPTRSSNHTFFVSI